MPATWSLTYAAKNTGYGEMGRRGKLKKGSRAAKLYMAKLRALRGRSKTRRRTSRRLRGGDLGSSALEFSNVFTKSVEGIFSKLGTSLTEAVSSPEKVLALAKKYGPLMYKMVKSILSKLGRFTGITPKPKPKPKPVVKPRPSPGGKTPPGGKHMILY